MSVNVLFAFMQICRAKGISPTWRGLHIFRSGGFNIPDATVGCYLSLCRHYGWVPTLEGLLAFTRGDREKLLLYRKKETA